MWLGGTGGGMGDGGGLKKKTYWWRIQTTQLFSRLHKQRRPTPTSVHHETGDIKSLVNIYLPCQVRHLIAGEGRVLLFTVLLFHENATCLEKKTNKQTEKTVRPLCTTWSLGIHSNSWFHQKPSGPNWTSVQSSIYHWPFVITGEQYVHTESVKTVYTHSGGKKLA